MTTPASRILVCLEALQDRPAVTGAELADRLGVDPRTVRRYVAALQDLGIPVAGERGPGGGYSLRPGYRLPPLMLDDDEAAAVVLGLVTARAGGADDADPAADRALAKLRRVLPDRLRRRVEALALVAASTGPPVVARAPAAVLLELADAIGRGLQVTCRYVRHDGTASARRLSPFGIVAHADRWYLVAHDHDRGALRTFRADRVHGLRHAGPGARAPDGFDPAGHLRDALADVPWAWGVHVTLGTGLDDARSRLPPGLARLTAAPDGRTELHLRVDDLDDAARLLAGLGCALEVHAPDELRDGLRRLAARLQAAAGHP